MHANENRINLDQKLQNISILVFSFYLVVVVPPLGKTRAELVCCCSTRCLFSSRKDGSGRDRVCRRHSPHSAISEREQSFANTCCASSM